MSNFIDKLIANQFKKPTGLFGRKITKYMEKGNSFLYDEILKEIDDNKNQNILEIGFGPGIGINKILKKCNNAKLDGIDFSKLMYKKTKKLNKKYIKEKKLDLINCDFEKHDFKKKKYDLIIAINVLYFWDSLQAPFKKIFNLLNQEGCLVIFFMEPEELTKIKITQTEVFNKYDKKQIEEILKKSGIKKIEYKTIIREEKKGYFLYAYK